MAFKNRPASFSGCAAYSGVFCIRGAGVMSECLSGGLSSSVILGYVAYLPPALLQTYHLKIYLMGEEGGLVL